MGTHRDDFDEARRRFVQASAHAALGLLAVSPFSAEAATPGQNETGNRGGNRGKDKTMLSLQEISDRIEIEDLLVRYCYAIDDRDWNSYRRLFTPDAVLDDTVTGGIRSGVEEHVTYLTRALSKILISQHAISTILLDIREDDASARVHCSCPMVVDIGGGRKHVFFQGLWYRDRLVRTPEGWRIRELVEEGYWNHNLPEGFKF